MYWYYAAWAFAAGAGIPLMAMLNAGLGRAEGSPLAATLSLLVVALLTSGLVAAAIRMPVPAWPVLTAIPRHLFLGGCIAAFYIMSVTVLAPRFGVANTVMFVVTAQILASAAIDTFGLFGAEIRPFPVMRIFGLVILITGLVVTQLSVVVTTPPHVPPTPVAPTPPHANPT